jgi:hypothetical protein
MQYDDIVYCNVLQMVHEPLSMHSGSDMLSQSPAEKSSW